MLAKDIKNYRLRNVLTQSELANLCNVSKMTISMIETGKSNYSTLTEAKIRKVIGGYEDEVVRN